MYDIPVTQMTSMFEGKPHKTRLFPTKTWVVWNPGIYIIFGGRGHFISRNDLVDLMSIDGFEMNLL